MATVCPQSPSVVRRQSSSSRFALAVVLLLAGLGFVGPDGATRAAWAGDGTASPAAGADLTEALRAAGIRMELALEKARWLQSRGRRDEALAVLDEAMKIHAEVHARWQAASSAPAVPPPAVVGPRPSGRPPPTRGPTPQAPASVPDVDELVVTAARAYLLERQRPDGFFEEPKERATSRDPADAQQRLEVETGLAVAALCDLGTHRPLEAIRRGASALARASAGRNRPLHPIAAWGLASALTHVDDPGWRGEVERAVEAVLTAAARGSAVDGADDWDALADTELPGSMMFATAWAALLLHEVAPMAGPALADRIEAQLESWRDDARDTRATSSDPPHWYLATELVAGPRFSSRDVPYELHPDVLARGVVVLFAMALNQGPEALAPSRAAQVRTGDLAGSWPLRPAIRPLGGRIAETALHLLAWRVPHTAFVSPVTEGLGG